MKTVPLKEVMTIAMVNGNEEKHPLVIMDGILKEWVGFGWISLGDADKNDYENYPMVDE